jgi:tRNA(Ile)-lysidine synthase
VGFSGGADSVALLSVLVELGYRCIAAHCNFHLRGEESYRDERFAEGFAKKIGVVFEKIDFDTEKIAKERHISIEMAARELRYAWFEELKRKYGAQSVAVAHHKDDSVETLLLNLVRGTGIRGVSGIRCESNGVTRPLLCVGRDEIEAWLKERNQYYVTDSTNLSDEYTRNFIRLRVIPLLKEINPSIKDSIFRTSQNLLSARNIYEDYVDRQMKYIFLSPEVISIKRLLEIPEGKSVLYEALTRYGFNRIVSEEAYESVSGNSGKVFYSDTHKMIKDRDTFIIEPLSFDETGEIEYYLSEDDTEISNPIKLTLERLPMTDQTSIIKRADTACLDYDRLKFPLTLRKWRAGDSFVPLGMKGRKKLSDFFTDRKYDLLKKNKTWLLCSGEDIVWIVGERIDDRYSVRKSTKKMMLIKFSSL